MGIELRNCTELLLMEAADKVITRNSIAVTYSMALCSSEPTDWARVNAAIIERWSPSALTYIKERAWAIAEGRREP